MSGELSELEQKFFQTGELPPELNTEQPAAVETPPEATPVVQNAPSEAERVEMLLREERARLEQRMLEAQTQLQQIQQSQQQPSAPDAETDPLGHLIHQVQTMGKQLGELQTKLSTAQQQQQQQQQLQQFASAVQNMRDEFAKANPDYYEAVNYLRDMRSNELKALGYAHDQIQQALTMDEISVAQTAIGRNKNPAQAMYEIAKLRGFKTPDKVPPLDQVRKGMQADSSVPRADANKAMTVDSLKSLADSDLDKIAQSDDLWHKVMGGSPTGKGIF